jgi:hypothetical protein
MTRIATKIIALGLLVLGSYMIIWFIPPKPYLVYSSILDKQHRLATIPAPRLIFVGGSGIALGLDSELIEERIKLPVLNMGVNAGFGLRYMLQEVKPWIHKGDTILVIPEYEHFYGDLVDGDQNLLWALRIQPTMLQTLDGKQIRHLLPLIPSFIQQRIQEIIRITPDPIYSRSAFSTHGDFINHLDLPSTPLALSSITNRQLLNQYTLRLLHEFQLYVQQRGARAYLIYPAIAESFWTFGENRKAIETLHLAILEQNVMKPLIAPADSVWPNSMFFDTVYHLSRQGRQLRSVMIADQLQRLIREQL